jgi:hypothetical protein
MTLNMKLGFYFAVGALGLVVYFAGIKQKDQVMTSTGLLTLAMSLCFAISVA